MGTATTIGVISGTQNPDLLQHGSSLRGNFAHYIMACRGTQSEIALFAGLWYNKRRISPRRERCPGGVKF